MVKEHDNKLYLNGYCELIGDWGKIKAEEKNRLEYFYDTFNDYRGVLDKIYGVVKHKYLFDKDGYKVYKTRIAEYFTRDGIEYCRPHEEMILTDSLNMLRWRVISQDGAESLVLNFCKIDDRRPIEVFEPCHEEKCNMEPFISELKTCCPEITQEM